MIHQISNYSFRKFFASDASRRSKCLNLIQDGGVGERWQKCSPPPTSFSPVTSTNVIINHKSFLTSNFNPFATLGIQKTIPSVGRNFRTWTKGASSKKLVFLVKPL